MHGLARTVRFISSHAASRATPARLDGTDRLQTLAFTTLLLSIRPRTHAVVDACREVLLAGLPSRTRRCSGARSGTANSQSLMSNHLLPNSHRRPACHLAFKPTWYVFRDSTSCRERGRNSPMTELRETGVPLRLRPRPRTRSWPLRPPRQLHKPPKDRLLRRRRRSRRLSIARRPFYGLPTPIPRR